ncbi:MAG TPA: DUF6263 family protein [Candidatus Kapabacteria bacterium]|nr:DUF6263 family protein [Candidatus Kapabacteria bacterium]
MTRQNILLILICTCCITRTAFSQSSKPVTLSLHPAKGSRYSFLTKLHQKAASSSANDSGATEQKSIVELSAVVSHIERNGSITFDASLNRIAIKQYVSSQGDQELLTMDTKDSLINFGTDAIEFSDRFKKQNGVKYSMEFSKAGARISATLDSVFERMAGTRYDKPVDNATLFVVFPDHSVSIGESWNNTSITRFDNVQMITTDHYTLKSVDRTTAEIDLTQSLTASGEGGTISGKGSGSYTIDIATGMTQNAHISSDIDMTIKDGTTETPMKVTSELTIAAAKKKR